MTLGACFVIVPLALLVVWLAYMYASIDTTERLIEVQRKRERFPDPPSHREPKPTPAPPPKGK